MYIDACIDAYKDAYINAYSVTETPLFAASRRGHLHVVKRLLAQGADVLIHEATYSSDHSELVCPSTQCLSEKLYKSSLKEQ